MQWVLAALSPEVKQQGREAVTTHFQLMPRFIIKSIGLSCWLVGSPTDLLVDWFICAVGWLEDCIVILFAGMIVHMFVCWFCG
jgi:chloramphenicol 3-O-phosphotransferase